MAFGTQVPPWLHVGPTDYLHAIQSGTQTGLAVAEAQNRAQAAIAARVLAQQKQAQDAWEFGERMRLAAEESARKENYDLGVLDWHRQQLENDARKAAAGDEIARARLNEYISHNMATEDLRQSELDKDMTPTEINLDPNKYYVTRGGAVVKPHRAEGEMTQNQKEHLLISGLNAMKPGPQEDATSPTYQQRTNIAQGILDRYQPKPIPKPLDLSQPLSPSEIQGISGLPTMVPLNINAAPQSGTGERSTADRRAAAEAAIAAGAPREAVAKRFKDLTGEDF